MKLLFKASFQRTEKANKRVYKEDKDWRKEYSRKAKRKRLNFYRHFIF